MSRNGGNHVNVIGSDTYRTDNKQSCLSIATSTGEGSKHVLVTVTENGTKETHRKVSSIVAGKETRVVNILRAVFMLILGITAAVVCTGVFKYTRDQEEEFFRQQFEDSALSVLDSFHGTAGRCLGAIASLSSSITSHAKRSNESFPFVTLPDFAARAAEVRVLTGTHSLYWTPLVTNITRKKWEEYAADHRFHVDEEFETENYLRKYQDENFGLDLTQDDGDWRHLQHKETPSSNLTVLEDATNYHPFIWSNGAIPTMPEGDLSSESIGPYLPAWQMSPVTQKKQYMLNLDLGRTRILAGIVDPLIQTQKAIINRAVVPVPQMIKTLQTTLRLSQYREHVQEYVNDPNTFLAYPVFDELDPASRSVVGILSTNLYWKNLFQHILPASRSICAVIENSYGQTFTYKISGPIATFVGMVDAHDHRYDHFEISENVDLPRYEAPINRAYLTVAFSETTGLYKIRLYPLSASESMFITNHPIRYMGFVLVAFVLSAIFFLLFSYTVEKRQRHMMEIAIANANRATAQERELNEFLSHEVRNPLSAAISACTFVLSSVNEEPPMADAETKQLVREDTEVIHTSLHFVNDFLRSMLDAQRASGNLIQLRMGPTDLLKDVIQPASSMLCKRVASFDIFIKCPENLVVMTDCLRLKQVVLNLVGNSAKFVERGFLRIGAEISGPERKVSLFVEDSGPGIPQDKRENLYSKYQSSLDILSQGTGIGLSLSKALVGKMNGDLYLDTSYDSGLEGCPGARFVIDLKTSALDINLGLDEMQLGDPGSTSPHDMCGPSISNTKNSSLIEAFSHSTTDDIGEVADALPEELSLLFVDDDLILRKLFVRAARRVCPQWKVLEAASGEIALSMCESETFDVIFLDQYMASVDKQMLGTETARAMRSAGIQSKICGLSANDLADSFLTNGADYFILKPLPVETEELKSTFQTILKGRRTEYG